MKQGNRVLLFVAVLLTFSSAYAGEKTCKVSTNDVGTIVGTGSSREAAFDDAATKCFDRHAQLFRMKHGSNLDEDSGLVVIDVCANIRCG